LVAVVVPRAVPALDGDLDPAFGGTPFPGTLTILFDRAGSSFDDRAFASGATAQGLVIAGAVASGSGGTDIGIIRITYAGQLDTTFGTNGRTVVPIDIVPGGIDRPNSIATDPVGRFVIGAGASTGNGAAPVLVRLTANGLVDPDFALDGKRIIDEEPNFRGPGALAIAGPDSSVYYAAVAQRAVPGSSAAFYIGRLPASGLGVSQFGVAGRTFIEFPGQAVASVNDFVLHGSTLLLCGGVINGSTVRWAFASVPLAGGTGQGVALDASEAPTPNAGDHACSAIAPSRFTASRIYLAGGGLVGGKNGVVVAAVNASGSPDPSFSGDGYARFLVTPGQTYATVDAATERSSGRVAIAGSLDRTGQGTDAFTATLDDRGAIDAGGTTIHELLEDARQSRISALVERGGLLYLAGWLQYGATDPGDFDFLAMKTLPGNAVFGHGFE
jgi:hypothetical protein